MNLKYFDYIVIYFSVLLVCVSVGAVARLSFLSKGGDDYTANIVFWSIAALSILIFAIIILFLDGIIVAFRKKFPKKLSSKNFTVDLIPSGNLNHSSEDQKKMVSNNSSRSSVQDMEGNIEDQNSDSLNMESIRKSQLHQKQEMESEKLQIAVSYTRTQFALYATDEDINNLCASLICFLRDSEIGNASSVCVDSLKTIDLLHFGWNVWNHHKLNNQRKDVAKFLKIVFSQSFKDMEESTIEKLLSSRKNDGLIKIDENLLK